MSDFFDTECYKVGKTCAECTAMEGCVWCQNGLYGGNNCQPGGFYGPENAETCQVVWYYGVCFVNGDAFNDNNGYLYLLIIFGICAALLLCLIICFVVTCVQSCCMGCDSKPKPGPKASKPQRTQLSDIESVSSSSEYASLG